MHRYRVVIMLILLGVLPVVLAGWLTYRYLLEPEPEPASAKEETVEEEVEEPAPERQMQRVFAASRELPVGTLLRDEDLTELEVESGPLADGRVPVPDIDSRHPLRGYVVRETVGEGAPVTWGTVLGPDQRGFLAAVLGPDKRAVTIRLGPATSHAGLVDPGDRVDVILSAPALLAFAGGEQNVFASTIVEDVRVLAIDRLPIDRRPIDRGLGSSVGLPQGDEAEAAGAGRTEVERTEVTTATLEVTPAQGERLVLGDREGTLALAVRSLAPLATATGTGTGATGDASARTSVELGEILLPPEALSASQAHLQREQALSTLTMQRELTVVEQELRAAKAAGAAVRIFRGSEPADEVVFANP